MAQADEPDDEPDHEHRLSWEHNRRFHGIQYATTISALFHTAMIQFRTTPREEPRWTDVPGIDYQVRKAVRLESADARNTAGNISDPLTLIAQIIPVTEALAIPVFFDDWNFDVAWQMTMINAMGIGTQGLLNRIAIRTVARQRPEVGPCRTDRDYHQYCGASNNASFFSGHAGGAFAGAGLACAHHLFMPLYGNGVADAFGCAVPLAIATTTSTLRLMTDRHYFTDVLVGALIGLGTGFALPLINYRAAEDSLLAVVPGPAGVTLVGEI